MSGFIHGHKCSSNGSNAVFAFEVLYCKWADERMAEGRRAKWSCFIQQGCAHLKRWFHLPRAPLNLLNCSQASSWYWQECRILSHGSQSYTLNSLRTDFYCRFMDTMCFLLASNHNGIYRAYASLSSFLSPSNLLRGHFYRTFKQATDRFELLTY